MIFLKEEDSEETEKIEEEETQVISAYRRKRQGRKKETTKDMPVVIIQHDLPEEDCQCDNCHGQLTKIGTSSTRDEVVYQPAVTYIERHITYAYTCKPCERQGENKIKKSSGPKPLLRNSLLSASLLAIVAQQKFEYYLPINRQVQILESWGLSVSRQTMTNWLIFCMVYLEGIYDYFHDQLLSEAILHIDETPINVLSSKNKRNYMWAMVTSQYSETSIVFYYYDESRGGDVARELLDGFEGYLQADGYAVYTNIPHTTVVHCLAHIRRKFFESTDKAHQLLAAQGLDYCDQLFEMDAQIQKEASNAEERLSLRQERLRAPFEAFVDLGSDYRSSAKI